jgi:hypothetical protein
VIHEPAGPEDKRDPHAAKEHGQASAEQLSIVATRPVSDQKSDAAKHGDQKEADHQEGAHTLAPPHLRRCLHLAVIGATALGNGLRRMPSGKQSLGYARYKLQRPPAKFKKSAACLKQ